MVSAIQTNNERDNRTIWAAALISASHAKYGIIWLPVTRLKDAVRYLLTTDMAPNAFKVVQDANLRWLDQALLDAQDLGLEIEGSKPESVHMPIEHAHNVLRWIMHRNGPSYSNFVYEQAEAMAKFLNGAV